MSVFLANCDVCGPVEVKPAEIVLVLGNDSQYSFPCPLCASVVVTPANEATVAALLLGGCEPFTPDIPAEALEPKPGPALTYDDLLDFALALSTGDLLAAELQGSTRADQR